MQDLTQNWSWILIAVAVVAFFFLRRGHGRRGGFGHGGDGHGAFDGDGDHRHHRDREDDDRREAPWPEPPEAVVDPVSGTAVHTAGAMTSVYQGRAYYFASKENRDRFEAAPQDYANKVQGIAIGGSAERPRRRRHGC